MATSTFGLRHRRGAPLTGVALAALTLAATTVAAPAGAATDGSTGAVSATARYYTVQLAEPPAASFTGSTAYAATRPAKGRGFDARSEAVRTYRAHLEQQQKAVLDTVGATPTYQYSVALNGFAALLTDDQKARLQERKQELGIISFAVDTGQYTAAAAAPAHLGPKGEGGGRGPGGAPPTAGRGTVIGVLDTGYWPENAFFAGTRVTTKTPQPVGVPYRDRTTGRIAVKKADGGVFEGDCERGEQFGEESTEPPCNSKVISARMFAASFVANVPREHWSEGEVLSPRDGNWHGSHIGSIAAGNSLRTLPIHGVDYGPASGVAPGAKLAVYKVCWTDDADGGTTRCRLSDTIKGIDQAVADGVDVINYSITGSPATVNYPLEQAFLGAADAGVFVATSAGNDGPASSKVAHPSPWVTTVAAGSDRPLEGTVVLGDGTRLRGASLATKDVPSSPLVLASTAVAPGAADSDARVCKPGSLDRTKVAGAIVACERGVIDRVEKSKAVAEAEGVGMILFNTAAGSLDAEAHSVPTVHLDVEPGTKVVAYAASPSPTARILVGTPGEKPAPRPQLAEFSSRGPSPSGNGDILKPDLSAPGVSVFGAVTPSAFDGESFSAQSGTSMAAPHVAGSAAVLLSAHPGWSPMAVKSALMTSAGDLFSAEGARYSDPFGVGAGMVDSRRTREPGLIYDATSEDWRRYLAGIGSLTVEPTTTPIRSRDLNQASITISDSSDAVTVTRTVTATRRGAWSATGSVPGYDVEVAPRTLTFARAGESRTFTVTLSRRTAAVGAWQNGYLTWKDGPAKVRSPIVARWTGPATTP